MKLIETSIEYDGNMETKRLFIRSIKESDEIAFINGIADRQLRVAYGFQADMDSETSSRIFHQFCGLTGGFSIIEKASENMVGFLLDVKAELPEDVAEHLPKKGRTLAFSIFPEYQRHGYMEEVLNAYISSLFENREADYVHCGHFVENEASRHLLSKLGFYEFSRHTFKARTIVDRIKTL